MQQILMTASICYYILLSIHSLLVHCPTITKEFQLRLLWTILVYTALLHATTNTSSPDLLDFYFHLYLFYYIWLVPSWISPLDFGSGFYLSLVQCLRALTSCCVLAVWHTAWVLHTPQTFIQKKSLIFLLAGSPFCFSQKSGSHQAIFIPLINPFPLLLATSKNLILLDIVLLL